jgi:hypothetical protein
MNIDADSVMLRGGVVNYTTLQNATAGRAGNVSESGKGLNVRGQTEIQDKMARGLKGGMESPIKELASDAAGLPRSGADAVGSLIDNFRSEKNQGKQIAENIAARRSATGYSSAGKQVGSVIPGLGTHGASGAATTGHPEKTGALLPGLTHGGQPVPVTLAPGSALTVNFTGRCPHCDRNINSTEQARSINTPSQATNR